MMNDQIKKIKVLDLELDINNPRFAELYNGDSSQDAIVNYLLKEEGALDIAKNILKAKEFYVYEPLWVIKKGDKYLVKDGNRRLSAVIALSDEKYGLDQLFPISELPVFVFDDEQDLDRRIAERHSVPSFKEWSRIAKALMVYRIYKKEGEEGIYIFDSKPKDLLKLASFYYAAVMIGKDNFKKLVRKGKGENGGKTIIFERLFAQRKQCGYDFKNNSIIIQDKILFAEYIHSMIAYLSDNLNVTHAIVNTKVDQENFLKNLKDSYDFGSSEGKMQLFSTKNNVQKPEQETKLNEEVKEQQSSKSITGSVMLRRRPSTQLENQLFGGRLIIQKGKINDLCIVLEEIFKSIKMQELDRGTTKAKLLIIGAGLRMLLDMGAEIQGLGAGKGADFYTKAKNEFKHIFTKKYKAMERNNLHLKNLLSSDGNGETNIYNYLSTYSHTNVIPDYAVIVQISIVVGLILLEYFGVQS